MNNNNITNVNNSNSSSTVSAFNSNNYNTTKDGKNLSLVSIRYELFDHLIYPLGVKFDENVIIQLFRKLHIMSTIDYKISINEWVDESLKSLSGFTGIIFNKNFQKLKPKFYSIPIKFFQQISKL